MKIGIYNRYWSTCGGGENYTGSIAQILSQDHEVELISIEPVDWNRIQTRLRLDLSRCTMRQWPADDCARLAPLTACYDLFINSTYCSSIQPHSTKSAAICYFPHRLDHWASLGSAYRLVRQTAGDIARRLRPAMSSDRHSPLLLCGHFDVEPDGRRWLGPSAALSFRRQPGQPVSIPLWPGTHREITGVWVDGKPCAWTIANDILTVSAEVGVSGASQLLVIVECRPMVPSECGMGPDSRRLGICLDTRSIAFNADPDAMLRATPRTSARASLHDYDRIISISQFTTEWVGRRWGLRPMELAPPIDTEVFSYDPNGSRERSILSVGRFFAGGHNKKHHEMARAFIRMRRDGVLPDGWRLVLAGARHLEHQRHLDYFANLKRISAGHPIDILPDVPFQELLGLYRRSSIYWHAAGWGEREAAHPERLEHFGITTCEAMSSGCIPVVYDGAGQREIVCDTAFGHRFRDYGSLSLAMRRGVQAHETGVIAGMRAAASGSISRFARNRFRDRVMTAFSGLAY